MNTLVSNKQILGVLIMISSITAVCVPVAEADDQKYNYAQSGRRDPFVP